GLRAFFYQLVLENGDDAALASTHGQAMTTHAEVLRRLVEWGLPVEGHWKRCEGVDAVVELCGEWAERRRSLDFDTDGVVVKVDDLALRARLGFTAKFPR